MPIILNGATGIVTPSAKVEDLVTGKIVSSGDSGELENGSGTISGLTLTGDISLGDNDKIIMGSGSDLQLYHDGTHSYISDAGTGPLRIITDGTGILLNKTTTESMGRFLTDGAVELFYDNAKKFETTSTGVTITGTGGGGLFKGENGTIGTSNAGDIFRVNEQILNTNTTIDSDENASATGPLEIASSVTLTVNGNLTVI